MKKRPVETVGIFDDTLVEKPIKGTLIGVSHDNLGGNQLYGLVESFSAAYFCRICLSDKNETRSLCEQDDSKLRTVSNYREHYPTAPNSHGIKFNSILNDLHYYNIFDNYTVDIKHDVLEGVAQLEIKYFLKFIIGENLTTLNEINMPLILADIVSKLTDKQKLKFKVLILLLNIMDIIFCPVNSPGMVLNLKYLITEHHTLFQAEYDSNLTPKHHMMIHYPMIILKSGPLIGFWCMRFEAKHAYFKDLCNKLKNYKTLCKTLAYRHQQCAWYEWHNLELSTRPTYGKCKLKEKPNFLLHLNFEQDQILSTQSVQFLGCIFKKGCFIVQGIHDDSLPVFLEITDFFILNDLPCAICKKWKTSYFEDYYHSYIIETLSKEEYVIFNLVTLKHVVAYEIHHPFGLELNCIVLKYEVVHEL
ncbi:hypothetical protein QE152_g11412 [Popillia japonica]|uniref:Uncharacterized protein n=1 Tax=Popillia japonica TaxID=7064 RepID=A0AAW1LKP2_POPJA